MVNFYGYLVEKIRGLPVPSASARGALYRSLLTAVEAFIERNNPNPENSPNYIAELLSSIKVIEREFDKAIFEDGKRMPDWVKTTEPRTEEDAKAEFNTAPKVEPPLPVEEVSYPVLIKELTDGERVIRSISVNLSILDQGPAPLTAGEITGILATKARVWVAILRRYIHTSAGTERLGYFWTVLEPIIQIVIVVGMYWVFGHSTIFGMPAIPFAIIGISAWLMMRMIMFRLGHGLGREAMLCTIPIIRPLDVMVVKAIFYGLMYTLVMILALIIDGFYGNTKFEIENMPLFLAYWFVFWVFSIGFGFSYARFIKSYPWIERISLFLLRFIYFLSGTLFVSEQLPTGIREWVLWIPTVHGIQLMRSAFFWEYESTDASATYFLTGTGLMLAFGMLCERTLYRHGAHA